MKCLKTISNETLVRAWLMVCLSKHEEGSPEHLSLCTVLESDLSLPQGALTKKLMSDEFEDEA